MPEREHELSTVPREARAFQGQRAGVVTRMVAASIDGGIIAFAVLCIYLGYAGLRFLLDPRHFTFPDASLFRSLVVAAGVMALYLTVAWAMGGRTYGNVLMGLRVVGVYGGDVGWVRAVLRAGFYVVFPIGLFWVVVDRRQRSIQDRVLATSVVYDWQPHKRRPPG